ncbi:YggT family protein [Endozoicomonadaceae bacterium StTr2]
MSSIAQTLGVILQTVVGLYVIAILLRFLLQLVKADFYNPLSQAIVKATGPLLNPLRRIIPGIGGLDFASLVLAFLVEVVLIYGLLALKGFNPAQVPPNLAMGAALIGLMDSVLNIYTFSIIIIAIASWIAPQSYNPALMLMHQIIEPLAGRIRRMLPPMGGLDFSIMVLLLIIYALRGMFVTPLAMAMGVGGLRLLL